MQFYHATLGSPAISTFTEAASRGYFDCFPQLTVQKIRRNKHHTIATSFGHLDQTHKNYKSTKPRPKITSPITSPPLLDQITTQSDVFPLQSRTHTKVGRIQFSLKKNAHTKILRMGQGVSQYSHVRAVNICSLCIVTMQITYMLKLCNVAKVDYWTLTDGGMPFSKLVLLSPALNALTMNPLRHWKSL